MYCRNSAKPPEPYKKSAVSLSSAFILVEVVCKQHFSDEVIRQTQWYLCDLPCYKFSCCYFFYARIHIMMRFWCFHSRDTVETSKTHHFKLSTVFVLSCVVLLQPKIFREFTHKVNWWKMYQRTELIIHSILLSSVLCNES